jgi:exosome complex component CSL4
LSEEQKAVKDEIILPGEKICTVEEFMPGNGTYDDGGVVRSAYIGKVSIDAAKRTVNVEPVNQPLSIAANMEVLAVVEDLKESGAIVEIIRVIGQKRGISGTTDGMIHISNVANRYVKSIRDAFGPGDLVLAKIVQAKPAIRLTTVPPNLGVVKTLCPQCRGSLSPQGQDLLECKECNIKVRRKVSTEYGNPHSV